MTLRQKSHSASLALYLLRPGGFTQVVHKFEAEFSRLHKYDREGDVRAGGMTLLRATGESGK